MFLQSKVAEPLFVLTGTSFSHPASLRANLPDPLLVHLIKGAFFAFSSCVLAENMKFKMAFNMSESSGNQEPRHIATTDLGIERRLEESIYVRWLKKKLYS